MDNFKPLNSDSIDTLNFSTKSLDNSKAFNAATKVVKDPSGTIPNGIYGVILWEKMRQIMTVMISLLTMIGFAVFLTLAILVFETSWLIWTLPISGILISFYKFGFTLVEYQDLKRSKRRYQADLNAGMKSTPPFIPRLYIKLYKKQVSHNWITFLLLFYGGLGTLLIWGLKDVSWWVFNFSGWIHTLMAQPEKVIIFSAIAFLAIIVIHIVFAIQRRKKILEINAYFGTAIASLSEIEEIRKTRNKSFRRIFLFSVLTIFIIPLLIFFLIKLIKRK